jgi:hypothetical protein
MAQLEQKQAAIEKAFLGRPVAEQDLVRSLIGLSHEEKIQLEKDNLAVLIQAAEEVSH